MSGRGDRLAYHERAALILTSPRLVSPSAVLVLLCLSHYSDGSEDRPVWPSVSTLADRSRLSPRSVRRALRELETVGAVAPELRAGQSTRYRVVWSALSSVEEVSISRPDGGEGDHLNPGQNDRAATDCTPAKMAGVDGATPDKMTGEGGQNDRGGAVKVAGGAVILAADRFSNGPDERSNEARERAPAPDDSDFSFLDEVTR